MTENRDDLPDQVDRFEDEGGSTLERLKSTNQGQKPAVDYSSGPWGLSAPSEHDSDEQAEGQGHEDESEIIEDTPDPEGTTDSASVAPVPTERPRNRTGAALIGASAILAVGIVAAAAIHYGSMDSVPQAPASIDGDETAIEESFGEVGLSFVVDYEKSNDHESGELIRQNPEVGERLPEGSSIELVYSSGPESVSMPDYEGMSVAEIEDEMSEIDVTVNVTEVDGTGLSEGSIVASSTEPGETVDSGSELNLEVASGYVTVDDVTDVEDFEEAEALLDELGLVAVEVGQQSEAAFGTVVGQSIEAGETVEDGSEVEVYVSTPAEGSTLSMPDLNGLSPNEAQNELFDEGFFGVPSTIVVNADVDDFEVIGTVPEAGDETTPEEQIVLIIAEP